MSNKICPHTSSNNQIITKLWVGIICFFYGIIFLGKMMPPSTTVALTYNYRRWGGADVTMPISMGGL